MADTLTVRSTDNTVIGVIHTGTRDKGVLTIHSMRPFNLDGDDLQKLADKCKEVANS